MIDNQGFIKHGAFECLMAGNDVVAFASINRDEDPCEKPANYPSSRLGHAAIRTALLTMKIKRPYEIDLSGSTRRSLHSSLSWSAMPSLSVAGDMSNLSEVAVNICSFLGLDALVAESKRFEQLDLRMVLEHTTETILVMCYTFT